MRGLKNSKQKKQKIKSTKQGTYNVYLTTLVKVKFRKSLLPIIVKRPIIIKGYMQWIQNLC